MKQLYQYMPISFNFSPRLNHLHPLQVENCDSNSRLVLDEDDNGKFRLERVKLRCADPALAIACIIDNTINESDGACHHKMFPASSRH